MSFFCLYLVKFLFLWFVTTVKTQRHVVISTHSFAQPLSTVALSLKFIHQNTGVRRKLIVLFSTNFLSLYQEKRCKNVGRLSRYRNFIYIRINIAGPLGQLPTGGFLRSVKMLIYFFCYHLFLPPFTLGMTYFITVAWAPNNP